MQTFLTSTNSYECAQSLDSKRLNKQILECYQILNILSNNSPSGAWRNHPAVLMWKGYEHGLWKYVQSMVSEAKSRGIKTDKNEENLSSLYNRFSNDWGNHPQQWWMNQDTVMRIITTHKANLFKKDPMYYLKYQHALSSPYNTPCCDKCQYFWVTHYERQNAGN